MGFISALPTKKDVDHPAPHKIHIRGVDDLTTEEIRAFAKEHFSVEPPTRIEWIDDTSANIVYSTPIMALKALSQLSLHPSSEISSPLSQLQAAKPFSSRPEATLQVRTALLTDQKRPRAYEASRFYMMHPEHDPREQRHCDQIARNGPRGYNDTRHGLEEHYRKNKFGASQNFSPTMYDNYPRASTRAQNRSSIRRRSGSTQSSFSSFEASKTRRAIRATFHGDLCQPEKLNHRSRISRDRSASPSQGNFDRLQPFHSRRRTPPPPYQANDSRIRRNENCGKELFPVRSRLGTENFGDGRKFFTNKRSAINMKKELFPYNPANSNHRRSDAFDAADETADIFANTLSIPFKGSTPKVRNDTIGKTADTNMSIYGYLKSSDSESDPRALKLTNNPGFDILGASKLEAPGFSIRGLAEHKHHLIVEKELFPTKAAGNAGKELFAEKLQGRGVKRNRAEDIFY